MASTFLQRIRRDETGAMAIEFALIAPALFLMLFGVMQVGMAMQNYNAIRNVSADVARYAMVQYQTGNELSPSQLRTFAENHALGAPYMLDQNRVRVEIDDSVTQRVSGATEMEIRVTYQTDSLLEFADISMPIVRYNRPLFLLDE
ncbi:hypothetical protein AAW01_02685 [Aurantiacibacter gangjinensis]|uniref:TadE-like domain-containing protein n=2 Tax=Aurantiacibacter gangjinensis TaxID=502682 RepID=A0A0G9MSZ5_9SPHN|nr:hypothetical protein AAW01_02685 [Aurantiacibacter gangjinensis]